MALIPFEVANTHTLPLAIGSLLVLTSLVLYIFHKPAFPKNAPKVTNHDSIPLIGALKFFTRRIDFMKNGQSHSPTGNFSFYAGMHPVVGLSGKSVEQRRVFLEDKRLGFSEGYAALLAGAPEVKKNNNILAEKNGGVEISQYFTTRLVAMLKGNVLRDRLPQLLQDARKALDSLAQQSEKVTDPFESIYRMVFQFTMRTVACTEIADDPVKLEQVLKLFEQIDAANTPTQIMYPWVPTPSKLKRLMAGTKLYMMFQKIIDERKASGRQDDDALQFCLDHGDNVTDIITFVVGALFAGQVNSGINSAAVLCYLANNAEWMKRVSEEVEAIADKYAPNKDLPLKERLMHIPIEAWEGEFHAMDYCLKETIRLQMCGTAFRKNSSNTDVVINKQTGEVIPAGYYVAMAVDDMHLNPDLYPNPREWDPARYSPERAEDKKETHAWMGWGVARHPCLGMRFAKLEINLIVAFFLAYFDNIQLLDEHKKPKTRTWDVDRNRHGSYKPTETTYIQYRVRPE
ncbi:hypothetical protein CKM354_001107600 [Cercospora kikuchii]|uniref:Uncharacterized protein n=1 Tax=Cercospora kikuchii TaxID=84275 RepID=A0A9P3FHY9_9PEZI|nr:uncharacterized protein CKM354_001107600 [Cercospora kikuchii]GIZ48001.1 hypothetical protein CKM354_001107600 [Cercospora kikuchii]